MRIKLSQFLTRGMRALYRGVRKKWQLQTIQKEMTLYSWPVQFYFNINGIFPLSELKQYESGLTDPFVAKPFFFNPVLCLLRELLIADN